MHARLCGLLTNKKSSSSKTISKLPSQGRIVEEFCGLFATDSMSPSLICDLRVAKVMAAEKVEEADKLLKLTLDLGGNKRQIVSGIAKAYKPEDMIGKNIIIIANLKPAKIRGVESNGMLRAAADGDNLVLAVTDGDIESGAVIWTVF